MKKFIYLVCFLFTVNTLTAQNIISQVQTTAISCNGGFATWNFTTDAVASFQYKVQTFSGFWTDFGLLTTVTFPITSFTTNLPAGTARIKFFDLFSNPTNTSAEFVVNQPAPFFFNGSSSTAVSCNGLADGEATVNLTGATPPYDYVWNTIPIQIAQTAINLPAGAYSCTVTDDNGCSYVLNPISVTVTEPAAALIAGATPTPVTCFGGSDGTATANPSGGTPFTIIHGTQHLFKIHKLQLV
jgi:hypothetical protein